MEFSPMTMEYIVKLPKGSTVWLLMDNKSHTEMYSIVTNHSIEFKLNELTITYDVTGKARYEYYFDAPQEHGIYSISGYRWYI